MRYFPESLMILLLPAAIFAGEIEADTIDLKSKMGIEINAAGPVLLELDTERGLLYAANTLTSSLTIVYLEEGRVRNVPLEGRAYQHLKPEAITHSSSDGRLALIGAGCFFVLDPETMDASSWKTGSQFESVAIDEGSGNVFLSGRESGSLGFLDASGGSYETIPWLDTSEPLVNMNATPPPPVRKVVADPSEGKILAIDGYTSTVHVFDGARGVHEYSRGLPLTPGGRWHLAGYDDDRRRLFLIRETSDRKVTEAAMIDMASGEDVLVELPGLTEGVGMIYSAGRGEVFIPYDNHPAVHAVSFENGGSVREIAIPAYGNDASALDDRKGVLYIGSWAHGELDAIDLEDGEMIARHTGLGIIPHMFSMVFDPKTGAIAFPKGASAVNGTFGAAITLFDPSTGTSRKIRTGFAPVDIMHDGNTGKTFVFGNEDRFAVMREDGTVDIRHLPFDYPLCAARAPGGGVYLSYGPHQSYWPAVYIWGAKNGILHIGGDGSFYDRRIPRQAMSLAAAPDGAVYFTQNNWGREEQFVGVLEDRVRLFDIGKRLRLTDEVERETTQRILEYDPGTDLLYLVRTGETDTARSVLQMIDRRSGRVLGRVELGMTAVDLVFDERNVYVANFDSRSVSVVSKEDLTVEAVETGPGPLRLCPTGSGVLAVEHLGNAVTEIGGRERTWRIPFQGKPDNIFLWKGDAVISSRSSSEFRLLRFDPDSRRPFRTLLSHRYPYGDTSYDTDNSSFYMRGQFGDAVFDLSRSAVDSKGRLMVTDFLSGKVFVLDE